MFDQLQELENLAKKFGLPIYENLKEFPLVKEGKSLIPYLFAKNRSILPVEEDKNTVVIAISDPKNIEALQEIKLFLKKEISPIYCSKISLDEAIEKCYHQKKQSSTKPSEEVTSKEPKDSIEGYDLLEQESENHVIRLFNSILIEAIRQEASDIHFEPEESSLLVRFRIDGILLKRFEESLTVKNQLITRIKVMAKLDIAEQRLPQDGRLKIKLGEREIDFRVSTIPTHHGERVVLRILDKGNILGLKKIGMDESLLEIFRKIITLPEGIILVTGPTGSGKTTTLYSALSELNSSEMNIMTIEDPIEYKLAGIAQIGVNPKIELTFSKGLKHILRQDPDVIMVGEIRDVETAEIAIQASLTGHLVFTTLHTNDAPSAIARLGEMGIEPYLLSSSIVAVIAQRLVRKICPNCKSSYVPSRQEILELGLREKTYTFFKGLGCDQCYETGYKGRIAVYELMQMTPDVKMQIMKSIDSEGIRKAAAILNLRKNAARLVSEGITTSAEVLRVTRMTHHEDD